MMAYIIGTCAKKAVYTRSDSKVKSCGGMSLRNQNQDSLALSDWVQVGEVGQVWQGELLVGRLRESGIDAQLIDQTFHQEPLTNVRAFAVVRVVVPRDQEQQARRLMAEGFE